MVEFERTFTTDKSFDEAVSAIEAAAAERGFRVLHTHDVAGTLAGKGFPRPPLKIIEVCNAKCAATALSLDVRVAAMLPCPIVVYATDDGETLISTMLPSAMSAFLPDSGLEDVAAEVEASILAIIEAAR